MAHSSGPRRRFRAASLEVAHHVDDELGLDVASPYILLDFRVEDVNDDSRPELVYSAVVGMRGSVLTIAAWVCVGILGVWGMLSALFAG